MVIGGRQGIPASSLVTDWAITTGCQSLYACVTPHKSINTPF